MKKTGLTILAVTSTLVFGGMVRANAATITEEYNFNAVFPPVADLPTTWSGSFTITFDPTLQGARGPFPLDAFQSTLPASYGTFVYSQDNNGLLSIGDDCIAGSCRIEPGSTGLFSFFVDASGVPTSNPPTAEFSVPEFPNLVDIDNSASVTLGTTIAPPPTPPPVATPVPAALPLFATGLGALGLLGWRRKRKSPAAVA